MAAQDKLTSPAEPGVQDSIIDFMKIAAEFALNFGKYLLVLMFALYVVAHSVSLIAHLFGPYFEGTKFGKLLERVALQRSAKSLLKEVLEELGYRQLIDRIRHSNENQVFLNGVQTIDEARVALVQIVKESIVSFPQVRQYGRNSPQKSSLYIDTISSAFESNVAEKMARLLLYLISNRSIECPPIDFVLVPKSGNVLLGQVFSQLTGWRFVLRKDDNNNSRSSSSLKLDPEGAKINFEGFNLLLREAGRRKQKMYGIVIDCNCSGGSSIKRAIEEWNNAARQYPEQFAPISEAFVLFRPDVSKVHAECADGTLFKVTRYFDLTEKQKEKIESARLQKLQDIKSIREVLGELQIAG